MIVPPHLTSLSFYFIVFETGFNCVALASLELSYKTVLGWNSWLPLCCYFPGADAGITGVNHRVCLLIFKFYLSLIIIACICCLCKRECGAMETEIERSQGLTGWQAGSRLQAQGECVCGAA